MKFTRSTYPTIYRIVKKVRDQGFAYHVVDHADPARELTHHPIGGARLVRLDMPELERMVRAPKRIEILGPDGDAWSPATVDRIALDGRVRIR